jgi:hypothetical protein
MQRRIATGLVLVSFLAVGAAAEAARVRVARRPHRTVVTVHRGFPLRRTLPRVVVRGPVVAVRVTPRVFLPPLVFRPVVVAVAPLPNVVRWQGSEGLEKDDEWTEFTLNVDRRGGALLLEIDDGPARISFVEVVFENGEAQVVDFDDKRQAEGRYTLLEFRDGRQVDHVRIVARAEAKESEIWVRLLS